MWTYAEQIRLLELDHGQDDLKNMSRILKKSGAACLERLQYLKKHTETMFVLAEHRHVSFSLLIPRERVKHLIGMKHIRLLTIEKMSKAYFDITDLKEESIITVSALEICEEHSPVEDAANMAFPYLVDQSSGLATVKFLVTRCPDGLDPNFLFNTKMSSGTRMEFKDWGDKDMVIDVYGQLDQVKKAFTTLTLRLRKYAFKFSKKINGKESDLGISEEASWHGKYTNSAYVFVGGLAYDLTEGDLLAVFAQYGELVDVNLIRDKVTGKSKGFAFLAYEDQRSTTLAVDNLNGAQVLGRTIRVDHCSKYTKREEEDDETQRQKREARGVCRAFQRGECTRGDSFKFSHDEKRATNTGWVCRAFQRGECTRGESCKFSHDEKRATNTGWVCRAFQRGECTRGESCKFSHDEKRATNTGWVCRAFQRGECTRGDSCKFSHDEKRATNTGWVCRAFQRGECTRGDSCKFSHDEKRATNTGWGHEKDRSSRWDHDKFNGAKKGGTSFGHRGDFKHDAEEKNYREKGHGDTSYGRPRERERVEREEREEREPRSRDSYDRREQKRPGRPHDREKLKERSRRDHNDREGEGSSRQSETSPRQDRGR